ncbi:YeeE/YedE family protein [Sphingomonas sp. KRR8]|uniref:YeeE/YedE family protein n=1 Tax=Sphingomonas TaxID=13687 RepID=UPI000DF00DCF|nr:MULTISPECIES: YeeE/YedE thiosulfate transporter family protein [Sphingomonas]URD61112.1 YeeE/YedE family protein [Sphingomonas sp. KRR8]
MSSIFANAQPLHGLVGGVLIGLAAALMLLGAGRIAGVSGITARATGLAESGMSRSSAWLFLMGLPLGAILAAAAMGTQKASFAPWPVLAIAGLLVGIGTRVGSGCTSGHGVCGVSRLSARSMVATATFMAAGIATVAITTILGAR